MSQEHNYAGVFFLIKLQNKVAACNFIKKRLERPEPLLRKRFQHKRFLVNFEKCLRRLSSWNTSGRLFLKKLE